MPPPKRSPPPPKRPPPPPKPLPSVADLVAARSDCKIAAAIIKQLPPILEGLADPGAIMTLFLPNDSAFQLYMSVLGVDTAGLLALDPRLLTYLLLFHALPDGALSTAELPAGRPLGTSLPGYNVTVTKADGLVFVTSAESRAKVVAANLKAGQPPLAVVHVVDRVLVPFDLYDPPYIPLYGSLQDLLDEVKGSAAFQRALASSGVASYVLSRKDIVATLFIPTDAAFAALEQVLATRVGAAAAKAAMALLSQRPELMAAVLGDHVHLGEALSIGALASRTSLAVGLDAAAYIQPGTASLLVSANVSTGAITLSGLSSASVLRSWGSGQLVGAAGGLAVFLVDGVLLSARSAAALGLISAGAPPPPPAGSDAGANSTAPVAAAPSPPPAGGALTTYGSLTEAFMSEADLAALWRAAAAAKLTSALSSLDAVPVTIFAPTTAAFTQLTAGLAASNPAAAAAVNTYAAMILADHIHVGASLLPADMRDGQVLPVGLNPLAYASPSASTLRVAVNASGAFVAQDLSAGLILRSVVAGSAVINLVDHVLISRAVGASLGLAGPASSSSPPPSGEAPVPVPVPEPSPADAPTPTPAAVASPPPSGGPPYASVTEALLKVPELSTLMGVVTDAGVAVELGLAGSSLPLTLFAPSNDAFAACMAALAAIDPRVAQAATAMAGTITADHVHLGEALPASELRDGQVIPVGADMDMYGTEDASTLLVAVNASGVFVSQSFTGAHVVRTIAAGPALIHIIDGVLISAAVADALGIPRGAVSSPPPPPPAQQVPSPSPPPPAQPLPSPSPPPAGAAVVLENKVFSSITEAMQAQGNLHTLLGLYSAASTSFVGAALQVFLATPYTLFAPTDEAFAAYFAASGTSLSALTADPFKMGTLLLPHLVLGQAVPYEKLTDGATLVAGSAMLATVPLSVHRAGAGGSEVVRVVAPHSSGAVVRSGITAGVAQVHVIDAVLS